MQTGTSNFRHRWTVFVSTEETQPLQARSICPVITPKDPPTPPPTEDIHRTFGTTAPVKNNLNVQRKKL